MDMVLLMFVGLSMETKGSEFLASDGSARRVPCLTKWKCQVGMFPGGRAGTWRLSRSGSRCQVPVQATLPNALSGVSRGSLGALPVVLVFSV